MMDSDHEDAIDVLVDSLFKDNGVVVDSDLASAMKFRAGEVQKDYTEEGERSAAIILLVASAINAALIPVLERWGAVVGVDILDKMSGRYRAMGVKGGNGNKTH